MKWPLERYLLFRRPVVLTGEIVRAGSDRADRAAFFEAPAGVFLKPFSVD